MYMNFILGWNPSAMSKYGMVDYDIAEIAPMHSVFPVIKVYLYDFRSEQSWSK